ESDACACGLDTGRSWSFASVLVPVLLCIFFFQAEDGIRDGHVTGVQTCALPISSSAPSPESKPPAVECRCRRGPAFVPRWHPHRSEERRVGKECRSPWSTYH